MTRPVVPPLTAAETSITGAGLALTSAVSRTRTWREELEYRQDKSLEAKTQQAIVRAMGELGHRLADHQACLIQDDFLDASVLAARDNVRRLLDNATVWLRMLNALYVDHIRPPDTE